MRNNDVLTVSVDIDPTGRDKPLILVSRKENSVINVINYFDKKDEVFDIYKKLLGEY